MGVQICKQRVITQDQKALCDKSINEITNITKFCLDDELKYNSSVQKLFDKFEQYAFVHTFEEYDYPKTFAKLGIKSEDYEYFKSEDVDLDDTDDFIINYVFLLKDRKWDDDERRVVINSDNFETILINYITLLFEDVETFKGCYKDSFWDYTLIDEYPDDKLHKDAKLVITTNEALEALKEHFKDDAPIQEWSLEENEILYISW